MGSIFAFGKKWRYAHMATLVQITGRRFVHHSAVLAAAWQAAPAATDAAGRVKLAVEGLGSQVCAPRNCTGLNKRRLERQPE